MEKAISWLMVNPSIFTVVLGVGMFLGVILALALTIVSIETLIGALVYEWPDKIRAKFGREENTNHGEEKVR